MHLFHQLVAKQELGDKVSSQHRVRLGDLRIPKVMGWDFIVDEGLGTWLLEVNRFPGARARRPRQALAQHQGLLPGLALLLLRNPVVVPRGFST